jgi:hypothetical protein
MTRAEAVTFLAEVWPEYITALGVTATDTAAGFKSAIDAALTVMGVTFANLATATVAASDDADFKALLNYFSAQRLYAAAGSRVDVSEGISGTSKRYSQMRDALKDLVVWYESNVPNAYSVGGMVVYAQVATRDPDPYAVEEVA